MDGPHIIDNGYKKFIKAADINLDTTSMLLKFHLLSEYYLEQMINYRLKRGDFITSQKGFSYFNKLTIIKAFDIVPNNLITCLEKLNTIRNKCSHEVNYIVTEADVDFIGNPLNIEYFKLKKEHPNLKELLHWLFGILSIRLEHHLNKITEKNNLTSRDTGLPIRELSS